MKKKGVLYLIIALSAAASFATTETSLNALFSPVSIMKAADALSINKGLRFGVSYKMNFFFDLPVSFFDIGLAFGSGLDFGRGEYKDATSGELNTFETGLFFSTGPAFLFNVGKRNSFFLSPGVRFQALSDSSYSFYRGFTAYDFAFNLDAGYRFWFITDDSFKFGINLGGDVSLPFYGSMFGRFASSSSGASYVSSRYTGLDVKIYLGIILSFKYLTGDTGRVFIPPPFRPLPRPRFPRPPRRPPPPPR